MACHQRQELSGRDVIAQIDVQRDYWVWPSQHFEPRSCDPALGRDNSSTGGTGEGGGAPGLELRPKLPMAPYVDFEYNT